MNVSNRAIALAAVLLIGAIGTVPAFAATVEEVKQTVSELAPTGNVRAHLKDGVVLLEGNVEDGIEKERIEEAMRRLDGVVDVQNGIITD